MLESIRTAVSQLAMRVEALAAPARGQKILDPSEIPVDSDVEEDGRQETEDQTPLASLFPRKVPIRVSNKPKEKETPNRASLKWRKEDQGALEIKVPLPSRMLQFRPRAQ